MSTSPASFADAIVWSPDAKALLKVEYSPVRPPQPLPTDDDATLLASLRTWLDRNPFISNIPDNAKDYTNRINLALGREFADDAGRAALARLLDYAAGRLPAAFDPELDGAVGTLTDQNHPLLALWLRHAGPVFVLDAVLAGLHFGRHYQNDGVGGWPVWVSRYADPSQNNGAYAMEYGLRAMLSTLPPDAVAALHTQAAARRPTASLLQRVVLSAAFQDPAWAAEDAPLLCASPTAIRQGIMVARLVNRESASLAAYVSGHHRPYRDGPLHTVERLGFDALPFLEVLANDNGPYFQVAHALTVLQCLKSAQLLAGFFEKKGYSSPAEQKAQAAVAQAFYAARPDLAIRALGPIAAGRSKLAVKVEPVLKGALRSHPTLLDTLRDQLDAKTYALLSAWAAPPAQLAAPADNVHPALLDPPWKKKAVPLPTLSLQVTAPYVPAWPDEVGKLYEPSIYYIPESVRTPLTPRTEAFDQYARSVMDAQPSYIRNPLLTACSDACARQIWEAHGSDYCCGHPSSFYQRFGVEVWPQVVRELRDEHAWVIEKFADVAEPRLAYSVAFAMEKRSQRAMAIQWLHRHPHAAALGLFPLAFGPNSKERELGQRALRVVLAHARDAAVAAAQSYGAEAERALVALEQASPDIYPKKIPVLPSFLDLDALSPLTLAAGGALSNAQTRTLLALLALSPIDRPLQVLGEIVETLAPKSAAEFAWDLCQQWLAAGADNKESWCLAALGHLGNDESARRITPLIRAWPGEAAHARAVMGLEVLARIGTDVALMHLHGIAQKLKFKGLQDQARQKIDQIAEARGMSAAELADRLVPDLDLDESGSRLLDFGPRQFRVTFDESLTPMVLDANQKRLTDLPKPAKSDDAAKAKEATDIWKTLKKDAKIIAQSQVMRLEQVMCSERRLSVEAFQLFFVAHPLMIHLVRRLVWGTYADGALRHTFRVAEDRSFADVNDDTFTLDPATNVGLVHRLELSDAEAAAWGRIFGDYALIPPFHQLDRETFTLTETERAETQFSRGDFSTKTSQVVGLENRGWRKGENEQGTILSMIKPLGADLYAELPLDGGIYLSYMEGTPEQQKITGCRLRSRSGPVRLDRLSPICASELLRDVEGLR